MKNLKMLGLAAIGALTLTAFGAGSASATVLCSTNTTPCTGTKYPAGAKLTASLKTGTKATLTTSLGNFTCTDSSLSGEVTNAGSSTTAATGVIIQFTLTGCELNGTKCTITTTLQQESTKNYHWELHFTSGGNGTLTVKKGTGSQDLGFLMVCGALINCKFTTSLATLTVDGGAPATVTASKIALTPTGGFCPSAMTLDAEYSVTAPNPLFVESS